MLPALKFTFDCGYGDGVTGDMGQRPYTVIGACIGPKALRRYRCKQLS